MQWFENEYDRSRLAEYVLQSGLEQGTAEEYYPGFRRSDCSVRSLGITAILHHYPYRQVYDREEGHDVPVFYEYYRMHVDYTASNGARVSAVVEFDDRNANVKRASDRAKPLEDQRDPNAVWDEAMAAVDASLLARAVLLGGCALPSIIVRCDEPQLATAA